MTDVERAETLWNLFDLLLSHLVARLEAGNAEPALMSVARHVLRDQGINIERGTDVRRYTELLSEETHKIPEFEN